MRDLSEVTLVGYQFQVLNSSDEWLDRGVSTSREGCYGGIHFQL